MKMNHLWRFGATIACLSSIAITCGFGAIQKHSDNGVPKALLKKLDRGVNITRWFCYVKPDDTKRFKHYLLDGDFQYFKQLGLGYVRLCVSPDVIYKEGSINSTNLPFLDQGIKLLDSKHLAVLLDLHDNGQMKIDSPTSKSSELIKFWVEMARHYKGQYESSVVFEILNEPVFNSNAAIWYKLQAETVKAIRQVDPRRTILVASTSWNGIDSLLKMEPLPESNLIYSVHCYDPFLFTHQGASWTGEQQMALHDIPFPSSPEAINGVVDRIPSAYQGAVRWYGDQRFDAKYLFNRLNSAMEWGAKHQVPVLLGEFGAYPPVSPVDSRARWFEGISDAIQKLKMPNAVWGYDDALGLGRDVDAQGKVKLDKVCLQHFFKVKP